MACLERTLAVKLNFAMPVVGSVVGSAAGLSAFYRGLGRFAGCGIDEAITDAFAMFPTLDHMLDLASQVVARRSNDGKA
jgi:hypothetical protein